MSYRNRKLGLIPGPMDHRDYPLSRIISLKRSFPDEYTIPDPIPGPYDQGDIPACVAYTLKAIKEVQEYRERRTRLSLSAAYIYGARAHDDFHGEGMVARQALSSLLKRGVCREELFPGIYPYKVCARAITPAMDRDARRQRIKTYTTIKTVEEGKTALMELGPFFIAVQVYDSFYKGGNLPMPDTSREEMHGYHSMAVVGWTRDHRWLCLNSWGKDWGSMRGMCTLPFNYPITEMWSLTDMIASEPVPEYRARIIQNPHSGAWSIQLGSFSSLEEMKNSLLRPLQSDLARAGKNIKFN